jgi:hypothetical protein
MVVALLSFIALLVAACFALFVHNHRFREGKTIFGDIFACKLTHARVSAPPSSSTTTPPPTTTTAGPGAISLFLRGADANVTLRYTAGQVAGMADLSIRMLDSVTSGGSASQTFPLTGVVVGSRAAVYTLDGSKHRLVYQGDMCGGAWTLHVPGFEPARLIPLS